VQKQASLGRGEVNLLDGPVVLTSALEAVAKGKEQDIEDEVDHYT
jgi:hypothetical protein